jgi:hypothetical protein
VPIGESTLFPWDKEKEIDTSLSFSGDAMIPNNPLGRTKRHHDIDTSDLEKVLVPSKNSDLSPFNSQLVIVAPSKR